MSDPILGTLAYPCEMCGAEPGRECLDSCPSLAGMEDWAVVEAQIAEEVIGTPPLDVSLGKLMAAVYRLPFSGLVGTRGVGPPDRDDFIDGDEFIYALADWMTEYQAVVRAEVDELSAQSRKAISLQFEKDVVTNYLRGVPA